MGNKKGKKLEPSLFPEKYPIHTPGGTYIADKEISEKSIEMPPEDFFKDWKPFSIGFCIGVLFSVVSFLLFSTWNC